MKIHGFSMAKNPWLGASRILSAQEIWTEGMYATEAVAWNASMMMQIVQCSRLPIAHPWQNNACNALKTLTVPMEYVHSTIHVWNVCRIGNVLVVDRMLNSFAASMPVLLDIGTPAVSVQYPRIAHIK